MEQQEEENCHEDILHRRRLRWAVSPPRSKPHGYRCVGAFALTFSQLSIAFLGILMVITLTSQDVQAGAWDPEEEISTDISPEWQRYPSIGIDGDKIHIVWEDNGDGDVDIYYRYFNGTDWKPEMEISTDAGSEIQLSPSVAVDGDRVYVVWENWRGGDSDISFRFFNGTDWEPEIELSSDSGNEAQWNPSIAAEGGEIHVTWEDREGGDLDIIYRNYNGTAWEPEQEISSDGANEDQRHPSIAVEGGEIHVVWEDRGDGDSDIYHRHFNGTGWLQEEEISVDVGNEYQWNPSVATEGGKVYCAWEHEEGLDYDIHYRLNNGTGWEPVFEISSDTTSEAQRYPSIVASGGKVYAAWMDTGDGDVDIYFRSFNGTDWQPEQEISSDSGTEWQWSPSIAAIGNKVHIVWQDSGEWEDDIYYRYFNGTGWEPGFVISEDIVPEEQRSPSIAAQGMRVHVVWQDPEDGDDDIYYRYFDGFKWQTEQEISTDVGVESQSNPSIAVDGDKIHFVWQDFADGDSDIYYRCLNGAIWEPEQEISTDLGIENQSNPSIAAWGGNIHIAWQDQGDGDADIYYRHFNGTDWEPEQEISIDVTNADQRNPSIAAENGYVNIVWEDQGDGDADIYYRYFNGTDWEPEQEISIDASNELQSNPSIAAENGYVNIVWEDQGDGDADIYYRYFNGTDWEPEQEISSDSGTEWQESPSISVENTKAHVVWSDNEDGDGDIRFRHFNGTIWGMELEISTDQRGEEQLSPSVAVDGGVSHVVWQDWGDGDSDVYYRRGRIEDFTPPESLSGPMAPYWRTTPAFGIDWTATDDHNLAYITLYFRYSPDNSSWLEWKDWGYDDSIMGTSASGDFVFGASYGDGYYEFATVASDTSWNTEPGPFSADAIVGVDTLAPSGSITIGGGEEWSTSENVTLSLTYSDSTSGVNGVRYGNDGTWNSEPWETQTTSKAWTLAPGDGPKTVYYQIRDSAGLESVTYSDSVQLDTTAPTIVTIVPNDGATDVKITAQIRVIFSEEMVKGFTEGHFSLKIDSLEIEGTASWSSDGQTLIFTPADNLTHDTTYRIVVVEGEDIAGNGLETPIETSFKTKKIVDTEPNALGQYWWIILLAVVISTIVILVILVGRRRQPIGEKESSEDKDSDSVQEEDDISNSD